MQTIKNPKTFKLICYIDNDKKTFNPALIVSNSLVEEEVFLIMNELRRSGRNVEIVRSGNFSDIKRVPEGWQCAKMLPHYKYDPYLIW